MLAQAIVEHMEPDGEPEGMSHMENTEPQVGRVTVLSGRPEFSSYDEWRATSAPGARRPDPWANYQRGSTTPMTLGPKHPDRPKPTRDQGSGKGK